MRYINALYYYYYYFLVPLHSKHYVGLSHVIHDIIM